MSALNFKNAELVAVGNFLDSLKLKGRASRGRTKLIKVFAEKNKEYTEDLDEIRKNYFEVDDRGELKKDGDHYIFKNEDDLPQLHKEMRDLAEEKAVIDCTEYLEKFKALYQELLDYPYELDSQAALIYDVLMDQLEKTEEEGN